MIFFVIQTQPTETPATLIYCDTDHTKSKSAGLRWIFTDLNVQGLARGSSVQPHVSLALMAEALTVRETLIHAVSFNITQICLRVDSQMIVRAITTGRRPLGLFGVLSDVESLAFFPASTFLLCCFNFVPRTSNGTLLLKPKACLSLYLGPGL